MGKYLKNEVTKIRSCRERNVRKYAYEDGVLIKMYPPMSLFKRIVVPTLSLWGQMKEKLKRK